MARECIGNGFAGGRRVVMLSVRMGAAMVLFGLIFSRLYALEVLRSLSGADRSAIFRALPVLMTGCASTLAAGVLAWLGRWARGDREIRSLVRALLIAFAAIASTIASMIIAGIAIRQLL
jgi:hypothetical protein